MCTDKECVSCGKVFPNNKDNFWPSKRFIDGYHNKCISCSLEEFKKKEVSYLEKNGYEAPSEEASTYLRKVNQIAADNKRKLQQKVVEHGQKNCSKCGEVKSLFEFNVDKKTTSGYSSWCKGCKREHNKQYRKGNTERIDNDCEEWQQARKAA
jgi:hypothetical protein